MPLISTTLEEILEIFVLDEYEQVGNPVLSTDHAISTQNTETCPRWNQVLSLHSSAGDGR